MTIDTELYPPEKSPSQEKGRSISSISSLKIRDFRLYLFSILFGFNGAQMVMVARGWLVYTMTDSPLALGLVGAALGLPLVLLSLFGGALADQIRKRNLLIVTQAVFTSLNLIIVLLIQAELIAIWHLIAAAFAGGVTLAFNIPTRQAFLMDLVGKKDLTNAIALNSVTMNVCRIASPALAGVLIKLLDIPGVYWIVVCSNLISLFFLVAIQGRGKIITRPQAPLIQNIKDGLHYVQESRIIFTLLVIAFIPILVAMPYQMLLPVFAKSVFQAGETGLGLLMSSVGAGALLGSSAVAILSNYRQKGLLMLAAGATFGVFLVLFAYAPSLLIASICLLFVGSGSSMFMTLTNSLIMENTPEAYVGRVMSLFVMTFGLMPLAVLPAGGLAEFVGAPLVVAGGGVILFLVIAGVYFSRSDIRQLK